MLFFSGAEGNQDCVYLADGGENYYWNDYDCTSYTNMSAICQVWLVPERPCCSNLQYMRGDNTVQLILEFTQSQGHGWPWV